MLLRKETAKALAEWNRTAIMKYKMTFIQMKIFNKILKVWEEKVGKGNVDEIGIIQIIKIADVHGDGKKRIKVNGETHLVPIEDIVLDGIRGTDVSKYPKVKS